MTLRRLLLGLAVLCAFVSRAEAACSGSGGSWSCPAGATISDINTAISSGTDPMVITFAGSSAYTWTSGTLTAPTTKAVTLICATAPPGGGTRGASASNSCTATSSGTRLILSGTATKLFRISGFVWNHSGSYLFWDCPSGGCAAKTRKNFRFDHNTVNLATDALFWLTGEGTAVSNFVYGVIDQNKFLQPNTKVIIDFTNSGTNNPPAGTLGGADNLFVEDNDFAITTQTDTGAGCTDDNGGGNSLVWRYNTMLNCRILKHGTQHAWGAINWEVYGNTLSYDSGANGAIADGYRFIHHQGSGTYMVFNNTLTPKSGAGHASNPIVVLHSGAGNTRPDGTVCDGNSASDGNRSPIGTYAGYNCKRQPGRDVDGKLYPIYNWGNQWGDLGTRLDMVIENSYSANTDKQIVLNRDVYNAVSLTANSSPTSPFNGTTGMGFGTLANRPTTCTTGSESADTGNGGVGYWATDVGVWNRTLATASGRLYRCSATNTWTVAYTPYPYPHPLRGEGSAPAAPSNARVGS